MVLNRHSVSTPMDPSVKLVKEEDTIENVPYRELIGSLMYLSVRTRPDISHVVSRLSQFNDSHSETHWKAAKRVLCYLKGTQHLGIVFSRSQDRPSIYVDADWGNCTVDRRSYTVFAFIINGAAVSWESKKQPTVALSMTEAEYMALSEPTKEAFYVRRLMKTFGMEIEKVVIKNDNMGAQKLAANPVFHSRTKHIDIRHHFVRDILTKGQITIEHVPTTEMTADILTKCLTRAKHENCV